MRVRILMLQSVDQLSKGFEYFLPQELAARLIACGYARQTMPGPSETKPAAPSELKSNVAQSSRDNKARKRHSAA